MNALLDRQVDGFIIAPAEHGESNVEYLKKHDIPFVLIDRYFPGIETNWVSLNNYKASYEAVQHLIDSGNKRPGLITYNTDLQNLQERRRGYENALKENGIDLNGSWSNEVFFGDDIKLLVETAIEDLLSLPEPVDSILFTSNTLALYGLKYVNEKRIKIPDDLSLVTFDEIDASDLFYAPLTYLKQPIQEMGQVATKILLENIENEKEIVQINLDATLVVRQSTGSAVSLK
jgi:LacI family transcriptional regulator